MTDIDQTAQLAKHAATPAVLAASLYGFASALPHIVAQFEAGTAPNATKEQRADAEQAAQTFMRNSPGAIRYIRLMESAAEEIIEAASSRRDEIMTSMFGPDDA